MVTTFSEEIVHPRGDATLPALVGPKNSRPEQCENAEVRRLGKEGARILSGMPINPEDSLVLYIGEEAKPYRVKVVWARREGLIPKRRMRKVGQAFLAGCRIKAAPSLKTAGPKRLDLNIGRWVVNAVRLAVLCGIAGVTGLVGYALISLLALL